MDEFLDENEQVEETPQDQEEETAETSETTESNDGTEATDVEVSLEEAIADLPEAGIEATTGVAGDGADDPESEMMAMMEDIVASGLFDEEYYLEVNVDVAEAIARGETTALKHFLTFGRFELREFSRLFSVSTYLGLNQDVAAAVNAGQTNAFDHFWSFGRFELREFSYLFNVSRYLEFNEDIAAAVNAGQTNAFAHFWNFGRFERREFSYLFNVSEYLEINQDVVAAVEAGQITAYEHFARFGRFERREFSRVFSISEYLQFNPDVAAAVDAGIATAFDHLVIFGVNEFRKLNKFIDLGFFVAANASLLQSTFNVTEVTEIEGSDLVSYLLENAVSLGLATSESFNFSSLLASFSAEQLIGFFGTVSTVEISFSEIAEFFSSTSLGAGILTLTEFLSAVQLEQLFGSATFTEISVEAIDAFLESSEGQSILAIAQSFSSQQLLGFFSVESFTQISISALTEFVASSEGQSILAIAQSFSSQQLVEFFSVESFTQISISALTQFVASSEGQSILAIATSFSAQQLVEFFSVESFTQISISALTEFLASSQGQSILNIAQSFSSQQLLEFFSVESFTQISISALTQFLSSSEGQQTGTETQDLDISISNNPQESEPPTPPETTASFDFEYIIRTNLEELQGVEEFSQIDFENLEALTASQIAAIIAYAQEQNLNPSPFVDAAFLQSTVSVQLANLNINIEGLSQQQLIEAALEEGISPCPTIDFGFFTERYESILLARFGVESVTAIGFAELFEFISTEALELGLSTSAFLDFEFYRTTYQVQLEERFGFSIEEITNQEIFEYANGEGLNEGLSPSVFVRLNYYKALYETEIIQFFGVETLEEVSNVQIIGYITTTGLEIGLNPSFSVGFNYFIEVYAEEIEAAGLTGASNEELLDFISAIAVEQGLNTSAFVNVAYLKRQYREEIRDFYDIEGVEELSDLEILQYTIGSEDVPFVDTKYYRWKYAQELEAFYEGFDIEDITDEEIISYALGAGSEEGLSLSAFDIKGYSIDNAEVLQEFYEVEDIAELSDHQIREFIVGAGWFEFDIEFVEYVDIEYYRAWDEPALIDIFGEDFTDEDVIYFVFGGEAPFIDEDYYKWRYGDEETEDGTLVKDLEGEDFNMYVFNEGWLAGFTNLSAFDLDDFVEEHATALQNFYEFEVTELTEAGVYYFIVCEAWKEGISIADFVSDDDIEFYRDKNEEALASFFDIDIEAVADLSANIVLDFQFGGLSSGIDYSYVRSEYEDDLLAFYGDVTSVTELSELQILEYVYSELFVAEDFSALGFTLSGVDVYGYARTYAEELAEYFHVDIDEVAKLDIQEIRKFIVGKGIELGIELEGFVNVEYLRETYEAAIVSFFEVGEEAELTDAEVLEWFGSEFHTIDVEFVLYQIEQLTEQQRTELFASLEIDIDIDDIALLNVQQLVEIAYSGELAAILEVEEVQKFAIDLNAYREEYAEELIDFYNPDEDDDDSDEDDDDSDEDTGDTGADDDIDDDIDSDDFGIDDITDKQVIKFMFGAGLELGIDPLEFVEVSYLREAFEYELIAHYQVASLAEISDELVVDFLYGDVSAQVDYEFYSFTYEEELTDFFGVAIAEITELQILEHVYAVGLPEGLDLTPADVEGYIEEYEEEIAAAFDVEVEEVVEIKAEEIVAFALGTGIELGLDPTEFADVDYYSENFSEQILFNYRLEQVYDFSYEQAFQFGLSAGVEQGLNTSATIDLDWYSEFYAQEIEIDFDIIDANGDSEIDSEELYDYITGIGLEQGQNPSELIDFETYRAEYAEQLIAYAIELGQEVESIFDVSYALTLEFMLSVGLEEGFAPSANVADLEEFRADEENAEALTEFYEVASIEEVTLIQTFNYVYGAGSELEDQMMANADPMMGDDPMMGTDDLAMMG